MIETLLLFVHLIGMCLAVGMLIASDLRLVGRLRRYGGVLPVPSHFQQRIVAGGLVLLTLSGVALIMLRLPSQPDLLANPKLQAKLLLVGVLAANALVLHSAVLPVLERRWPVARWTAAMHWRVSASVGLSHGMWLYCGFLGLARPWNHAQSLGVVLAVGGAVWLACAAAVALMLRRAAVVPPGPAAPPRGGGASLPTLAGGHGFELTRPRRPVDSTRMIVSNSVSPRPLR